MDNINSRSNLTKEVIAAKRCLAPEYWFLVISSSVEAMLIGLSRKRRMNMWFQEPGFCSSARGLELAILSLTFQVPLTHYQLSIYITDFFFFFNWICITD